MVLDLHVPCSRPGNIKRSSCIMGLTSCGLLLKNNFMLTKIDAVMIIIINTFHALYIFHLG